MELWTSAPATIRPNFSAISRHPSARKEQRVFPRVPIEVRGQRLRGFKFDFRGSTPPKTPSHIANPLREAMPALDGIGRRQAASFVCRCIQPFCHPSVPQSVVVHDQPSSAGFFFGPKLVDQAGLGGFFLQSSSRLPYFCKARVIQLASEGVGRRCGSVVRTIGRGSAGSGVNPSSIPQALSRA